LSDTIVGLTRVSHSVHELSTGKEFRDNDTAGEISGLMIPVAGWRFLGI
jgi:hypothetical protein